MRKKYKLSELRDVSDPVAEALGTLGGYRLGNPFPSGHNHDRIAAELASASPAPYSIIVFEELLDPSHFNYKRFVKITREKTVSEVDEVVYREFEREINERMHEYLKDNEDPENKYLYELLREYHGAARRVLREQYKERHPRSWKKKFTLGRITKERTKTRRERIYAMPKPLCSWDSRNVYQQFFVMPAQKAICQGGGASSYQREMQSLFGFAFASYSKTLAVTTHILVYDRHSRLLLVDTVSGLCLVAYDVGCNYEIPDEERRELLGGVSRVTRSGGLGQMDAVVLEPWQ